MLGVVSFDAPEELIPEHLQEALDKRNKARQEKNWAVADGLRNTLLEQGYLIEDSPQGARLIKKK